MAYQTGAYTDNADALSSLITFAVTQGWTDNSTSIGEGYQLYKSIDGVDCYANLNDIDGENPFPDSVFYDDGTRAIAVIGSTGTDASDWNDQPGATTDSYTSSDKAGGIVDELKAAGGNYYFFSHDSTLTAVFETDAEKGEHRMLTVGVVGGLPGYASSGGREASQETYWNARSAYLSSYYGDYSYSYHNMSWFDGTGWLLQDFASREYRVSPLFNPTSSGSYDSVYGGSLAWPLVRFSPDSFRGNQILAPSHLTATQGTPYELYALGELEGIKITNMTNLSDGEEVTYGSDTYKCFRVYGLGEYGVAFKK